MLPSIDERKDPYIDISPQKTAYLRDRPRWRSLALGELILQLQESLRIVRHHSVQLPSYTPVHVLLVIGRPGEYSTPRGLGLPDEVP